MFVIQFANKEAVFALVSTTTWYFIMSDEARSQPDPEYDQSRIFEIRPKPKFSFLKIRPLAEGISRSGRYKVL